MGGFTLCVETTAREVNALLTLHRVNVQVRHDVRRLLQQLTEKAYTHAAVLEQCRVDSPYVICNAIVADVVEKTVYQHIPAHEVNKAQQRHAALTQELVDCQRELSSAAAQLALKEQAMRNLTAAHHYTLHSYFREVFVLRTRLDTLARHAKEHPVRARSLSSTEVPPSGGNKTSLLCPSASLTARAGLLSFLTSRTSTARAQKSSTPPSSHHGNNHGQASSTNNRHNCSDNTCAIYSNDTTKDNNAADDSLSRRASAERGDDVAIDAQAGTRPPSSSRAGVRGGKQMKLSPNNRTSSTQPSDSERATAVDEAGERSGANPSSHGTANALQLGDILAQLEHPTTQQSHQQQPPRKQKQQWQLGMSARMSEKLYKARKSADAPCDGNEMDLDGTHTKSHDMTAFAMAAAAAAPPIAHTHAVPSTNYNHEHNKSARRTKTHDDSALPHRRECDIAVVTDESVAAAFSSPSLSAVARPPSVPIKCAAAASSANATPTAAVAAPIGTSSNAALSSSPLTPLTSSCCSRHRGRDRQGAHPPASQDDDAAMRERAMLGGVGGFAWRMPSSEHTQSQSTHRLPAHDNNSNSNSKENSSTSSSNNNRYYNLYDDEAMRKILDGDSSACAPSPGNGAHALRVTTDEHTDDAVHAIFDYEVYFALLHRHDSSGSDGRAGSDWSVARLVRERALAQDRLRYEREQHRSELAQRAARWHTSSAAFFSNAGEHDLLSRLTPWDILLHLAQEVMGNEMAQSTRHVQSQLTAMQTELQGMFAYMQAALLQLQSRVNTLLRVLRVFCRMVMTAARAMTRVCGATTCTQLSVIVCANRRCTGGDLLTIVQQQEMDEKREKDAKEGCGSTENERVGRAAGSSVRGCSTTRASLGSNHHHDHNRVNSANVAANAEPSTALSRSTPTQRSSNTHTSLSQACSANSAKVTSPSNLTKPQTPNAKSAATPTQGIAVKRTSLSHSSLSNHSNKATRATAATAASATAKTVISSTQRTLARRTLTSRKKPAASTTSATPKSSCTPTQASTSAARAKQIAPAAAAAAAAAAEDSDGDVPMSLVSQTAPNACQSSATVGTHADNPWTDVPLEMHDGLNYWSGTAVLPEVMRAQDALSEMLSLAHTRRAGELIRELDTPKRCLSHPSSAMSNSTTTRTNDNSNKDCDNHTSTNTTHNSTGAIADANHTSSNTIIASGCADKHRVALDNNMGGVPSEGEYPVLAALLRAAEMNSLTVRKGVATVVIVCQPCTTLPQAQRHRCCSGGPEHDDVDHDSANSNNSDALRANETAEMGDEALWRSVIRRASSSGAIRLIHSSVSTNIYLLSNLHAGKDSDSEYRQRHNADANEENVSWRYAAGWLEAVVEGWQTSSPNRTAAALLRTLVQQRQRHRAATARIRACERRLGGLLAQRDITSPNAQSQREFVQLGNAARAAAAALRVSMMRHVRLLRAHMRRYALGATKQWHKANDTSHRVEHTNGDADDDANSDGDSADDHDDEKNGGSSRHAKPRRGRLGLWVSPTLHPSPRAQNEAVCASADCYMEHNTTFQAYEKSACRHSDSSHQCLGRSTAAAAAADFRGADACTDQGASPPPALFSSAEYNMYGRGGSCVPEALYGVQRGVPNNGGASMQPDWHLDDGEADKHDDFVFGDSGSSKCKASSMSMFPKEHATRNAWGSSPSKDGTIHAMRRSSTQNSCSCCNSNDANISNNMSNTKTAERITRLEQNDEDIAEEQFWAHNAVMWQADAAESAGATVARSVMPMTRIIFPAPAVWPVRENTAAGVWDCHEGVAGPAIGATHMPNEKHDNCTADNRNGDGTADTTHFTPDVKKKYNPTARPTTAASSSSSSSSSSNSSGNLLKKRKDTQNIDDVHADWVDAYRQRGNKAGPPSWALLPHDDANDEMSAMSDDSAAGAVTDLPCAALSDKRSNVEGAAHAGGAHADAVPVRATTTATSTTTATAATTATTIDDNIAITCKDRVVTRAANGEASLSLDETTTNKQRELPASSTLCVTTNYNYTCPRLWRPPSAVQDSFIVTGLFPPPPPLPGPQHRQRPVAAAPSLLPFAESKTAQNKNKAAKNNNMSSTAEMLSGSSISMTAAMTSQLDGHGCTTGVKDNETHDIHEKQEEAGGVQGEVEQFMQESKEQGTWSDTSAANTSTLPPTLQPSTTKLGAATLAAAAHPIPRLGKSTLRVLPGPLDAAKLQKKLRPLVRRRDDKSSGTDKVAEGESKPDCTRHRRVAEVGTTVTSQPSSSATMTLLPAPARRKESGLRMPAFSRTN